MIISEIQLRNWRNFRAARVPLTERAFVIGPNAAGKSNFLDAIRFLRDIARAGGGMQRALNQRGGLSKIRCLAARKEPDVEIEVSLNEGSELRWRYALSISQQVRGYRQPIVRRERVWKGSELIVARPDADDKRDELRLTQTHLEQIGANAAFRDIVRFFDSVRYLHLVPQVLKHPESFQNPPDEEDAFGKGFLEAIARTPEKTRRSRLRRIEQTLREAVPNLKNLTDTKDEGGVPHLEATYEHWRPNAGRQREDQFSDGTLRLIGLFWSLLEGDSTLLLEEPELSLHTAIVSKLPALFARLQSRRRRQILVSTHSYELLADKSIAGEEVIMLTPDPEGTKVQSAASLPEIRDAIDGGLTVADVALPRTAPPALQNLSLFDL